MTAEIAIMNTYGVSLAADSAVTVSVGSSEKKIYNSANKVFTLSKYHPVGIMIYSNAQFMDIEWEIIIKEYRKKLGSKSFKSLFEYAFSFLKFIQTLTHISDEQKDKFFSRIVFNELTRIKNTFISDVENYIKENGKMKKSDEIVIFDATLNKINKIQSTIDDNSTVCISNKFYNKKIGLFESIFEAVFEKADFIVSKKNEIFEIMKKAIKKSTSFPGYSGIVISGYGDNEIWPSLYNCHIFGVIDNCLLKTKEVKNNITYNNKAVIAPFAQSEMVSSFMEGIDPVFEQTIFKEIGVLFSGISKIIKDEYQDKSKELQTALQQTLSEFKRKVYIDPIINIVGSLQKSDLAEMAEALVNLTSFKRHVSTESETVGGPTDVAVITKGDGFIWVKRKHYFDPNLNRHFFETYFKGGK